MSRIHSLLYVAIATAGIISSNAALAQDHSADHSHEPAQAHAHEPVQDQAQNQAQDQSQDHSAHTASAHNHASAPVDCVNLAMPPWNGLPDAARQQMAALQADLSAVSTPEAATAAGFFPVLGDIPGMGVHWVHPTRMADPVNIDAPDNLMFASIDGRDQLVGAAFTFTDIVDTNEPIPIDSELAKWHDHPQFAPDGKTLHMLHVWFVPSSNGPFAGLNFWLPYRSAGIEVPSSCWMADQSVGEKIQIVSFALVPPGQLGDETKAPAVESTPERAQMFAALDAAARAVDRDAWEAAADVLIADLTEAERSRVAGMLGVLSLNQMSSAERDAAGIEQPRSGRN